MPEPSIQERLFQLIRGKLPREESLPQVISEILCLSMDSTYRRIRGETPLVLEEARLLCRHFGISLDLLMQTEHDSITFTPFDLKDDEEGYTNFLRNIATHVENIAGADDKQIIYLAKDLPFFYHFYARPLAAFQYFFWWKSIYHHPDAAGAKFSVSCLPDETFELGQSILRTYASIPSLEIYNTECVNSTIAQIEYYREAGYFASYADIGRLYQCLEQMLIHLKTQVEYGCKFMPGEKPALKQDHYQFFYNRLVLGENTVLIKVDGKQSVYLNSQILHYITTVQDQFCKQVECRIMNLVKRSTLLSKTSDKERNMFFNKLLKKIPDYCKTLYQ